MEQSKYYTPKLEELYYGFKCELRYFKEFSGSDYVWYTFSIPAPKAIKEANYDFEYIIEKENIRVKFLDREDIESLGWKLDNFSNINGGLYDYSMFGMYLGERREFTLHHIGNRLYIAVVFDGITNLFEGTVKNKSELRKLMSMLGIANSDK